MTGPQLFRIAPAMPVTAYKTYSASMPVKTHFRAARCEEMIYAECNRVDKLGQPACSEMHCSAHAHGWRTFVDTATELGRQQASYIDKSAGRRYTVEIDGDLRTYTFPAGQACFGQHVLPLERDPILVVRDGDWRGNPTGRSRTHVRPEDWVEDFAEHQEALADEIKKGA